MRPLTKLLFRTVFFLVFFVALIPDCVSGEGEFMIKRIGNVISFGMNRFDVYAPENGLLTIRIQDDVSVYRELIQNVSAGDNTIIWDGCGFNNEKLYSKTYTVWAELTSYSGHQYRASFLTPVEYTSQCLQYALPSSETLSMSEPSEWFLEFRTVMKGMVRIEITSDGKKEESFSCAIATEGGRMNRKTFSDIAGNRQPLKAGRYTLSVFEESRPEMRFEYDLEIIEEPIRQEMIAVTGEILPDRGMSDEEIWQMMQKPSVVVNIDYYSHQAILAEKDENSQSLGTVHGQTQALKVIRTEGDWAFVGAWNHEEGEYIEGWVPINCLKVVYPQTSYGILIDKRSQTLTVYDHGQKIDTILVSTGRAEIKKLEQESAAGSFLTGYHRVDFSMNGNKYDYVIQYDGGNMLHQTPYAWGKHKKDFTLGRAYLGAKASHACIRIQAEPGEGGVNAYWIWTHIPFHTRVMILDDPEERRASTQRLLRETDIGKNNTFQQLQVMNSETLYPEKDIVLTFAGNLIPGGTPTFNKRGNSFVSFVTDIKGTSMFPQMDFLFQHDDFTCIFLNGILKEPPDEYIPGTEPDQAPPELAGLFALSSIEMVTMSSDKTYAAGITAVEGTTAAVLPFSKVLTREKTVTAKIKGHLFGFACCSETEYLKDPSVIDRRILELKEQNCEAIIFLCSWEEGKNGLHSVVQEAAAHRCVRAGADLFVGNQGGIVQGIDFVEDKPVIYSTGMLMDGSKTTAGKERGIIARTVFRFEPGEDDYPKIRVIPVNPYGSQKGERNQYSPECMSLELSKDVIESVWRDTTDPVIESISFVMQDAEP